MKTINSCDIQIIKNFQKTLLGIFHFENNDPNHFITLEDNGQIHEYLFTPDDPAKL